MRMYEEARFVMDKTGIGYIILAGLLVYGLFSFASWDQTKVSAATTETEIRMERQPEVVKATTDLGMTVLVKVIVGTLTSLIVAAGILAYQQARIRELKEGGWERFWQRRSLPKAKQANPKKPSVQDLILMMLAQNMKDKEK